jgi:hypothetical protein
MLRSLPILARLGLSSLLLTLLIGVGASLAHLYFHAHNRDEKPEFTVDDVRAAYHGIDRASPLQLSLERGHPDSLKPEQRTVLLKWLKSGRIAEDYDSIDLGESSPNEIIAAACVSCHSSNAKDPKAAAIRLSSLESLRKLASPQRVNPNPVEIVAMSTHAHALSLATLSIVLLGLLWLTRLPRGLVSLLVGLSGLALLADIGSWWLARPAEGFVWAIIVAGAVYNATTVLVAALVLADLWWPRRRA